jgi:hypothetical protein
MGDPLTALGLVANIITFVEFGFRVLSQARDIRDSVHGSTADTRELEMILEDVRSSNDDVLLHRQATGQALTPDENRIVDMARQCHGLAMQLDEKIRDLKVRDGRSKTRESLRIVLLSLWYQKDIDGLQKRLEIFDARVRRNLASALQRYIISYCPGASSFWPQATLLAKAHPVCIR